MSGNADGGTAEPQQPEKLPIGLIVTGILGLFVAIFVFSNDHESLGKFLNANAVMPMWAVILASGLVGAAIGWMATTFRRRARQDRPNS